MARSRLHGEIGDKLGPKLVDLVVKATLATRRGLSVHEARVRQAAMQALIDRAGLEVADHHRDLLAPLLAGEHGELHPLMHEYLSRSAAGTHQWHSLSGMLGSGVQSALSSAISNAVAPITYAINRAGPNLNADPQVWANGVAAGYATMGTGQGVARDMGLGGGNFQLMTDLAANIPDAGVLWELVNRGIISEADAEKWLHRAAVPAALRGQVMQLRRQLLSPSEAALAVLRGVIGHDAGAAIAAHNGIHGADFDTMVANTGEPLGLMQLLEAFRRGVIDEDKVRRGIRQSRVRNEWADAAIALRYEPMSTADAADAALRGHLSEAAAKHIAQLNGLRPQDWDAYWANQGAPPSDLQLLELWRHGHVTEHQVDEGLRQGRLRNTWIPAVKNLRFEPLSTADAIDAWLRGHASKEHATKIVEENGLLPRDVDLAFGNAGSPLALMQLLEAYRRKIISLDRLKVGIRQSRIRNEWIDTAVALRHSPASTAEAIEASVQGQLSIADAKRVAEENGLNPNDFGWLQRTAGAPLSRTELEQLFNRGLVSQEVVKQGLRESRLKDKYVKDALQLHVRLPESRQVITALTDGVITRQAATKLLGDMGYSHQVITMMIATGEVRSTGPHRQLMTGEVAKLYADRIISKAQATKLLEQLHYTAESAGLILQVADYTLQRKILDSGLAAVKAHYLAGRIDATTAAADLHALNLPPSASATYLKVWKIDRLAHPRQLTPAQIVKAVKLGLFTPPAERGTDQGQADNQRIGRDRLVGLGYSPEDALLLLEGA